MLVEDDNNLREIYGERLMAEGYEIVSAGDGEEALALAVKEKPDLIISDVMMPKISGFDMLDILRQTPETKFTKVIMMTALSQTEDKDRADRLGADKYLVKSQVTLEDVARVVHDLIYGPDEAEAPVASAGPETAAQEPLVTAPAPVAAAAVIIEPTAPVEPVAEPVPVAPVASEPVVVAPSAPAEPVAEPVVAPQVSAPEPVINPILGDDSPVSVAPAAASDDSAAAQSVAEETAAIAQQIDAFVSTAPTTPTHESPLVEPTEQDLIHAQNAVEDPDVIKPSLPEEPGSTPLVDPTLPPAEAIDPASVRKKVIEPITTGTAQPNINDLYEQEMALEAAKSPAANPATIEAPDANPITTAVSADQVPALETVDVSAIEGLTLNDQPTTPAEVAPAAPAQTPPKEDKAPDPNDPASFAL